MEKIVNIRFPWIQILPIFFERNESVSTAVWSVGAVGAQFIYRPARLSKKVNKDSDVADEKKMENKKDVDTKSGKVNKVKFEIYGEEMIEKRVKLSGNSGRVYLPPNWVGHHVKIIRID
jgi:putative transposon-encoded protein